MFPKALKTLLVSLLLLAWTLAPAGAGPHETFTDSVLHAAMKRGRLIVGMEVKFWPFEYADEKGAPVGFDVDLVRLMAKEMGLELEIKDMEWTGLIPALQTGKVDLIVSGMTATLERAKSVTFSDPYFLTGLCALVSKTKAPGLDRVEALNAPGRILAVKTGTTGDILAAKRFPQAELRRFKDETACAQEVAAGRADAFIYDQISVAKHHRMNPDTTTAILKPFTHEPFAMAMRKGDFDLWQWTNQFLRTIRADGRYDELHARHFSGLPRPERTE